jgi:nicotinate-nucleotide adenylyltransferase
MTRPTAGEQLPDHPAGARRRIGIFGGTFDPVHRGHLQAAEAVWDALGLDRMLLVVANDPWQKAGRGVSPAEDRYAMVAAAVRDRPSLEASRLEIDRGGPSYTIDTVRQLARTEPGTELFVVVGADVVATLDSWHEPDALADLVTLAVVGRPGAPPPVLPGGWRGVRVDSDPVDVSATELRRALAGGSAADRALVADAVPDAVVRCIAERGLYAEGR